MSFQIYLFLGVILIWALNQGQAAMKVKARQRLKDYHDVTSVFRRKRSISDTQTDGSGHIRGVFGLQDEESFEITAVASTAQGGKQMKMKETFKGKDVFGASITVTTDSGSGTIQDVSGEYVLDIEEDVNEAHEKLSEENIFDILINYSGDRKNEEHITNKKISYDIFTDDNSIAHSVANVEYLIETEDTQKRPKALIDTKTGVIMIYYDSLETCLPKARYHLVGGNRKVGKIYYDKSNRCLDMKKVGDTCYLENDYVKVVDMHNSALETSTSAASFKCNNSYDDSINGAYSPGIDALYFGTQIVKMFREWYNIDPINGGLVFRVHFSRNVLNAYWNGHNVSFGDGKERFVYPLVSLDIAAHELAHGFTEQNSGLIYFGQPGGLNEAFSDITGEMAELYTTNKTDWLVGAEIMYRKPMRYFDDPTKDRRSIAHVGNYSNRLPPHATSGIFNKVFYLLVHDYGLDPVEVYRVFVHANKMYWQAFTNFVTAACDVMQAAYDVGQPGEPFIRAFSEVGIEVCDVQNHLVHLTLGEATTGITVSNRIKPVFAVELPAWSKNVTVRVHSDNTDTVHIDLFDEKWAKINDTTKPVVSGNTFLNIDISKFLSTSYVLRLSTSKSDVSKVLLTANYTCQSKYVTSNFVAKKYYEFACGEM